MKWLGMPRRAEANPEGFPWNSWKAELTYMRTRLVMPSMACLDSGRVLEVVGKVLGHMSLAVPAVMAPLQNLVGGTCAARQ